MTTSFVYVFKVAYAQASSQASLFDLPFASHLAKPRFKMALTISMPMALLALVALLVPSFVEAHTVLTYPGWRGNTLSQNDKFPFGMQWTYPCKSNPGITLLSLCSNTNQAAASTSRKIALSGRRPGTAPSHSSLDGFAVTPTC